MELEDLNMAYESEVAGTPFVCRKGCSSCCTCSVNMTTAEGLRILNYLESHGMSLPDLDHRTDAAVLARTTNHEAAVYLRKMVPPDTVDQPWNFLPCLFLENDVCTIYPVRPFGCRNFGSLADCREAHSAEAPEWFITLNLFVMQIVEHLDRDGYWGNMFEVLAHLADIRDNAKLLKTERALGFLIPEQDRLRVMSYMAKLREIVGNDPELQELYTILGSSIRRGRE